MMSAQPYPSSGGGYPIGLSPTQNRNMYRNPGSQATTPVGVHPGQFAYPTPPTHSSVYRSPVPELTTFGLVTPPTATPSQFGSPLIAHGGYSPIPVGTPTQPWGSLNALSLSPMGPIDPSLSYGYHQPSPILGQDGTMTAAGEVFSTVPLRHHHEMGGDALGFHHPVYSGHRGGVFGAGPGLGIKTGPHGHLILGADGQPPTEIKKRSRSAQACERCRIRKARCFGGNPCNRCTKRRFVCEFSTAVRQRGPNKPQVNSSVSGGNGPTSAPPTVASSLASGKVSSATGASSGSSSATPDSPSKSGARRHSLPESSGQYIPHAPAKSFSTTEVPRLAAVSEEGNYLSHNWTVVPNLPTPTSEYLAVPQQPASAGGMRSDVGFFSVTPNVGTTTPISAAASAHGGDRSPMMAYTPEMDTSSSAPTTSSSVDYPYTPISPVTTFSPTLAMTPTGPTNTFVNV